MSTIANGRLTAALGALLLVLLAAEGATIPLIGELREEHVVIGLLLLAPVFPGRRRSVSEVQR